jgi:hypothetical protein
MAAEMERSSGIRANRSGMAEKSNAGGGLISRTGEIGANLGEMAYN